MGKTYIDTVKYIVRANVGIDGVVEKPDVVGALFGQTEGLLGDELDLRELQKSGRIGRIEVDLKPRSGKSIGVIELPSSLDRVETAILAAALETVDRIGPCEAKIHIQNIEDTRTLKRTQLVTRAKDIMRTMIVDVAPESKEITELVRDEVKTAEVQEYGPDKLSCGPNIREAEHIIVVEGRADVITMLKCDIKNVIAMQGKIVPPTIVALSREKTITAFVDGDRGGDLAIKQLAEVAEVDFVAKAPDGKEVEELTKKEVLKCLRRKIPSEQFMSRTFQDYVPKPENDQHEIRRHEPERYEQQEPRRLEPAREAPREQTREAPREQQFIRSEPRRVMREPEPQRERPREPPRERQFERPEPRQFEPRPEPMQPREAPAQRVEPMPEKYAKTLSDLKGTLKAVLFDAAGSVITETDTRNLLKEVKDQKNINAIVFDGIITQRLVDIANTVNIEVIAGVRQGRIVNSGKVKVYTSA